MGRDRRQMGPALLPTPLSPACGCADPARVSGEPSTLPVTAHAWRPMSSLLQSGLSAVLPGDLSPALAPASDFRSCATAFPSGRSHPVSAANAFAWPRPRSRAVRKACVLGAFAVPLAIRSVRFLTCPVPPRRSHPLAIRLAFGRSLLHAVSGQARGQVSPPSSEPELLKFQGLAAFHFSCLVFRRQIEGAPESAI
jgi:hypothetical protein